MELSLLKKAAYQSVFLMIAVIMFSYSRKFYEPVTIEAVSNEIEGIDASRMYQMGFGQNFVLAKKQEEPEVMEEPVQELPTQLDENYLMIKKPQGSDLTLRLQDMYINKSIQLTLSGMTKDDLTSDMMVRVRGEENFSGDPKYTETTTIEKDEEDGTSKEVVNKDFNDDLCHDIVISTIQNSDTNLYTAKILMELDTVYAYQIYEDSEYFYIDLRKPSEVYDKILVIDAGHGGKDGGALSRDEKYLEKNMNLEILLELKKLLDEEDIKVYYTRTSDETVYLRPRVELGNAVDCDYFISIHCNANNSSSPNGSEVLYYNNEFKGVKTHDLAKLFSQELGNVIPLQNKGIVERHYEDLYIMDHATVPMILIEVGYLTNHNDMNYLSKEQNRKKIAKGIYNGIMRAYGEMPVNKLDETAAGK